jgi:cytosine/creatinine deaminase
MNMTDTLKLERMLIPRSVRGFESDAQLFDIYIQNGALAHIESASPAINSIVKPNGIVLPGFADLHVHIDKTHVVDETGAAEGDLFKAIDIMARHRDGWTSEQIAARMNRAITEAHASGTRAMRTHLDWPTKRRPASVAAFEQMRDTWRGRMVLQAVALTPLDVFDDAFESEDLALEVASVNLMCDASRGEKALLGAFVYRNAELYTKLQRVFDLAEKNNLDIDFHVDEGLDVDARGLRAIADVTIKNGYQGRVTCGHACSLAMQPRDEALRTLDICAQAQIHLVSLPTTNLYLQGAWHETPVERGITRLIEAKQQGVNCSIATDNVQDAFFPYGSYNLLATWAFGVQAAHLTPALDWLDSITTQPAKAMGLPWDHRVREGVAMSQLVVTNAGSGHELVSQAGSHSSR